MPRSVGMKRIDFTKHWSVIDQTKDAFKKDGRYGIVIVVGHTDEEQKKIADFLARLNAKADMNRQHIVIENKKYYRELFQIALKDGLNVELIAPPE